MDDIEKFLSDENRKLRDSGCKLARAALRVISDYDGIHRLSLAVSEWFKTLADEGHRGDTI